LVGLGGWDVGGGSGKLAKPAYGMLLGKNLGIKGQSCPMP